MDFEATVQKLRARKERLQEEVARAGRREIKAILDELNGRFPRHHFYFSQGMGTETVFCDGGILGDRLASRICGETVYSRYTRERPVLLYVQERVDRIIEIAEIIDGEFLAQIGDIYSSRDSVRKGK